MARAPVEMAVWFRQGDPRYPFIWEAGPQPPARWHGADDGPVTYLADTPDGAWAEFLRHEEITDPEDLQGVARRVWAVEVPDEIIEASARVDLSPELAQGGLTSYPACQSHAADLRRGGARSLISMTAALESGAGRGERVHNGLEEGDPRDGQVLALFGGHWKQVIGWVAVDAGAPTTRQLTLVRHF